MRFTSVSPLPTRSLLLSALFVVCIAGCATTSTTASTAVASKEQPPPLSEAVMPKLPADPAPRTSSPAVLIRGGTVMTAAGQIYRPGYLRMEKGLITAVGKGDGEAKGAAIVDATGHFITPGIIDTHSHMGVYSQPSVKAHWDGNEATSPTTPQVWAEHGFWPQDPMLQRAVQGGVTTIQVLPGSANLIGGRSFVAKLHPAISARAMRFPGAPQGLKMACGENPKRVYGNKGGPQTRMGNVAGYRKAFQRAVEYKRRWDQYERDLAFWKKKNANAVDDNGKKDPPTPPARDLGLDTLRGVLEGTILVHNHCYRADEMSIMLDLADEFGFRIRSFHHALEAYKIRHRLNKVGTAASTWGDWWGFKMEAFDGIPQNAAMLSQAGVRTIIHSDSPSEIRHLNQEAQKARTAGKKVGITLTDDEVLRWVTANPAWALGVQDRVGTLEVGKMADVVMWDASPFSVYAHAERVWIDGDTVFNRLQRASPSSEPWSDFELGQPVWAPKIHPVSHAQEAR